ncbi:hypothetical protein HNR65_002239, partial [Desulfosalsimonas propionicica]|nr:hypothetical protein [Desulfosalsimonas propionicica]
NVRHMDSGIIGTSSSDYILFTNPSRHFPDESFLPGNIENARAFFKDSGRNFLFGSREKTIQFFARLFLSGQAENRGEDLQRFSAEDFCGFRQKKTGWFSRWKFLWCWPEKGRKFFRCFPSGDFCPGPQKTTWSFFMVLSPAVSVGFGRKRSRRFTPDHLRPAAYERGLEAGGPSRLESGK